MNEYDDAGGGARSSRPVLNENTSADRADNLVPVTIKQIHGGQGGDAPHINGRAVSTVKIIGIIAHMSTTATCDTLSVHDGTGTISLQIWTDGPDAAHPATRAKWECVRPTPPSLALKTAKKNTRIMHAPNM